LEEGLEGRLYDDLSTEIVVSHRRDDLVLPMNVLFEFHVS
jgi:hypothetical protein